MRQHARPALRQRRRRLALRDTEQQSNQIGARAIRIHRFDQPRIAIDQKRRRVVVGHDGIDRQRAVPVELPSDPFEISAHGRSAHTLLDRFSATDAGGDLPVGMKTDQLTAAKYRLRLLGRPCDKILRQYFIGESVAGAEILQRAFEIIPVAHKPDAAARGADRRLDDGRKADGIAQFMRRISRSASAAAADPIDRAAG